MKPLIYAHRGASAYAPENTMAAFYEAEKRGADGIELDVQMTKDGVLVVLHDEDVARTSNGRGLAREMTLSQLRELYADPLCTIGVHGTEHRVLTQVGEQERREEIFQSKDELEQMLGGKCDIFAYSNGRYDDGVLELVGQAGYQAACAVAGRPLNKRFDLGPYAYPCQSVEEATREMFRL